MTDLVRGLINVKTPLTLFAFIALIFLFAFRTKRVAELFFSLSNKKLSGSEFSALLHKFMNYAFIAFVIVCGSAVASQMLAYSARSRPFDVQDASKQVNQSNAPATQKEAAIKQYSEGVAQLKRAISTRRFSRSKTHSRRCRAYRLSTRSLCCIEKRAIRRKPGNTLNKPLPAPKAAETRSLRCERGKLLNTLIDDKTRDDGTVARVARLRFAPQSAVVNRIGFIS